MSQIRGRHASHFRLFAHTCVDNGRDINVASESKRLVSESTKVHLSARQGNLHPDTQVHAIVK